jgi:hypothetical protein
MSLQAKQNEELAVLECYRRLYKASTPSGNFDELMAKAYVDEKGYKHIPFNDYEIEDEHMQSIIEDVIKEYKIKPAYRQQAFKFTILLGASPMTKLKVE